MSASKTPPSHPSAAHPSIAHPSAVHRHETHNGQHKGQHKGSTNGHDPAKQPPHPLDVRATLKDKHLVVVGGTGFLGKVWVAMLLHHYPDIGQMYLLVRPRKGLSCEDRFWAEIAPSEVFRPLREAYGEEGFRAFLSQKVTPIPGDVTEPLSGIPEAILERLRGVAHVVVNVSGVVDFNPPIDEALRVNCFGLNHLVELCRTLGDLPILHTSTCYVAGNRDGTILEESPLDRPFPRCGEIGIAHWDPEREIKEGLRLLERATRDANEAFRESEFAETARQRLQAKGESCRGETFEKELKKIRQDFIDTMLSEEGQRRASHWGWPNTYTYTKSIGEQLLLRTGLRATIVRPSIIESASFFPFTGWNEGINTSAPLTYGIIKGGIMYMPGSWECILDMIPVDMVCAGMIMALAALLEDRHQPIYQLGSSDVNPIPTARIQEIISLYKRRSLRKNPKGNPLFHALQTMYGASPLTPEEHKRLGEPAYSKVAGTLSKWTGEISKLPGFGFLKDTSKTLSKFSSEMEKTARIQETFLPFMYTRRYRFDCSHIREIFADLTDDDRKRLAWEPEKIDWFQWLMECHIPGLEKWVMPLIDEKLRKKRRPLRPHHDLVGMLDEIADDNPYGICVMRLVGERLEKVTAKDFRRGAWAVAAWLQEKGLRKGDRVLLAGDNAPFWGMAYFGILYAGGTAVPLDPAVDLDRFQNLKNSAHARYALWDDKFFRRCGNEALALAEGAAIPDASLQALSFEAIVEQAKENPRPEPVEIHPDDVASLIFTSGTTGQPKGVMLTHKNFTAIRASLVPLFPLTHEDSSLSLLPLHHTFEFTCGLLLPLSCGVRITYLQELNGDTLLTALREARVSVLVGVPALWQMLAQRLKSKIKSRGRLLSALFDNLLDLNRRLGRSAGFDLGKLLFAPVHAQLGGHLRYLISGGAALPQETQKIFAGLGLHLAEGYGLTEAAPVLTVAEASPKAKLGSVGKPIPGVEIKIDLPNAEGIGEILARGPNVMLGYADNPEATSHVLTQDGWLRTGDLGKFDRKGRLTIVGRSKEVILTSNGENVYPDDLEDMIGLPESVKEFVIVGLPDGKTGESVALLAVPKLTDEERADPALVNAAIQKATTALHDRIQGLPKHSRPTILHVQTEALARTPTLKIKRKDAKAILERLESERPSQLAILADTPLARTIIDVLARMTGASRSKIEASTRLATDLGIDSLLMNEIHLELQRTLDRTISEGELAACQDISAIHRLIDRDHTELVKVSPSALKKAQAKKKEKDEEDEPLRLPGFVQDAAKEIMRDVQIAFYEHWMDIRVVGRANIPHNRSCIVVSNHASHLDLGLIKTALGSYAKDIVTLGAQDYFFEKKARRFYFENFTNVIPVSRQVGGLEASLQAARDVLRRGATLLLFPEGTRSKDGQIASFKPGIGYLATEFGKDILPVYVRGTYESMPKGRPLPTRRKLAVFIGEPLNFEDVQAKVKGLEIHEAARVLAQIYQAAVEHLRDRKRFDLASYRVPTASESEVKDKKDEVTEIFDYLRGRFDQSRVEEAISFYFSLGDDNKGKWSMVVTPQECRIWQGKPEGGSADCVLKTSPSIFRQIVREAYVPSPEQFFSGEIKSNNIGLLQQFVQIFNLSQSDA